VLITGLLGGFTTFASFALQSADMLAAGRVAAALAYVVATVVLGLAAVWTGLRCFA
jgi:fluoride exporter